MTRSDVIAEAVEQVAKSVRKSSDYTLTSQQRRLTEQALGAILPSQLRPSKGDGTPSAPKARKQKATAAPVVSEETETASEEISTPAPATTTVEETPSGEPAALDIPPADPFMALVNEEQAALAS